MYQYYTGKIPKKGFEYAQKSIRRDNADWDIFVQPKEINNKINESANSIITNCMQKDVNKRYDIRKLLYEIKSYKREVMKSINEIRKELLSQDSNDDFNGLEDRMESVDLKKFIDKKDKDVKQ